LKKDMGTFLVRYNSFICNILKPQKEKKKKKKNTLQAACLLKSIIMYNNFLIFQKKNYGCGQKNPMGEKKWVEIIRGESPNCHAHKCSSIVLCMHLCLCWIGKHGGLT
jgi:hypothetical protein